MDFVEFEHCCASYLRTKYKGTGCTFEVSGGTDSTVPDIVVKKDNELICNIEVKEPGAQCGQFVAFPDEDTRTFKYSELNHPKIASNESMAILKAMEANFDKYKNPSSKELGLNKQLYVNRIVDYYLNFKHSHFFMTRESVEEGDFIIFPTSKFADYFDVTACYRKKKSGSHNPNKKELEALPRMLTSELVSGYEIEKEGKYTNVLMDGNLPSRFILEDTCRIQFKNIGGSRYRVTGLSSTNNPNVIFTIGLKGKQKADDLSTFESKIGLK